MSASSAELSSGPLRHHPGQSRAPANTRRRPSSTYTGTAEIGTSSPLSRGSGIPAYLLLGATSVSSDRDLRGTPVTFRQRSGSAHLPTMEAWITWRKRDDDEDVVRRLC